MQPDPQHTYDDTQDRLIIRDRQIVNDDWRHLDDDAAAAAGEQVIVSLQRWQAAGYCRDATISPDARIGLRVTNTVDVNDLADALDAVELIALEFPAFTDGRAYSQARVLREQLGFTGEIRATGDVLRDQIFYMHRCGFNAFEVRPDRDINVALRAFDDFLTPYQGAADRPETVSQRRRQPGNA